MPKTCSDDNEDKGIDVNTNVNTNRDEENLRLPQATYCEAQSRPKAGRCKQTLSTHRKKGPSENRCLASIA